MVDSILIVDDEPYVLEALKRALADIAPLPKPKQFTG